MHVEYTSWYKQCSFPANRWKLKRRERPFLRLSLCCAWPCDDHDWVVAVPFLCFSPPPGAAEEPKSFPCPLHEERSAATADHLCAG